MIGLTVAFTPLTRYTHLVCLVGGGRDRQHTFRRRRWRGRRGGWDWHSRKHVSGI